ADVHLGQSADLPQFLPAALDDALLQLGRRLLGECGRDDVTWLERVRPRFQEVGDAPRDHLGLAGSGARNQLEVPAWVVDSARLFGRELHRSLPRRGESIFSSATGMPASLAISSMRSWGNGSGARLPFSRTLTMPKEAPR